MDENIPDESNTPDSFEGALGEWRGPTKTSATTWSTMGANDLTFSTWRTTAIHSS
jgi:hypothetical protein